MPRLDVSKADVLVLLLVANSLSPVASSLPALPPCSSPIFVAGAESLMSGRRVKGREAMACDAAGALDLVAVTGTLTSRGKWASLSLVSVMSTCRSDLRDAHLVARSAVPGRPPRAAARCERGRARRSAAEPP